MNGGGGRGGGGGMEGGKANRYAALQGVGGGQNFVKKCVT